MKSSPYLFSNSLIPIASIAWRVNLSSTVFHLGTAFLIYLSVYKLIKSWPAALLAAVFFSMFPLIWDYSLKAGVFPLNDLFAALIVYLIIISREYYMLYQSGLLDKNSYQNKNRVMVYGSLTLITVDGAVYNWAKKCTLYLSQLLKQIGFFGFFMAALGLFFYSVKNLLMHISILGIFMLIKSTTLKKPLRIIGLI